MKYFKFLIGNTLLRVYYIVKKNILNSNTYKVSWDSKYNNYGDIITPYILGKISNVKIELIEKSQYYPYEHYFVIGSILDRATHNTIVWGSGFISEDSKPIGKPKKIYAVRGPKTRQKFLDMDVECPEVYGDPALLLSRIYNPKVEKKYKLGIIPHYVDKGNVWINQISKFDEVRIIDIQTLDPLAFIRELLSCENIASSSLHGIITADSYSIPSLWLEFSINVVGNGFKFYDYFLSVGRENEKPLIVDKDIQLSEIMNAFSNYNINIDLDKLLQSCPFELK